MNSSKTYLIERSTDTGVFQDMDKFDLSETGKFQLSIRLQFPKFSKGFAPCDFDAFVKEHIGEDNLAAIGRLAFPNEWQMRLTKPEIREKLIRMGRTKVNTRSCWISPLSQSEIRGFVHWLPNAINDKSIIDVLEPFGEVLFIESSKCQKWCHVDSDSRYFAMNLKLGRTMDDLPHFFKIEEHHGLITVRGRNPACFHCKAIGHRKSECKKYRDKLGEYCLRKPNGGKNRTRPRGKRHKPSLKEGEHEQLPSKTKKKKKSKANASQTAATTGLSTASTASTTLSSDMSVAEIGDLLSKMDIKKNLEALQAFANCLSSVATKSKDQLEAVTSKLSAPAVNMPQSNASDSKELVPSEENVSEEKKSKSKKKKKKKSKAAKASASGDNVVAF